MTDSAASKGLSTDVVFVVASEVDTGGTLSVEFGTDIGIDFSGGPSGVTIGVERAVISAVLDVEFTDGGIHLTPKTRVSPPSGAHVALNLGGITGGGHLHHHDEPPIDEWLGAIAADLGPVDVGGLFIIGTIGGEPSFLAVLGVRFTPGIQLSFGFELTGVGGLIGINRTVDTDLMRARLAGGAVGNVLFCEDPLTNAPTILGDLSRFFPGSQGRLIVGPTMQLSWIKPIIRVDAGILIELPGPSKILIVGSLRVLVGADENLALLFLRMDFLGELDLQRQLISLDAQLVNSHALQIFRLTGGMALRMYYGPDPYVLLTIGGFHPRFDPGPLNLPAVPRVGAALEAPVGLFFRLEMYTAFTPNTLQAGAHVQAGMKLGPLSADGYFDFDALVTFKPFTFDIEFAAGFAIRVFGETFGSVDVSGRLTGPGPLVVNAKASVKVLFVRVRGSATFELGSRNGDSVAAIPSVIDAISGELTRPENVRASGGDRNVRLRSDIDRPRNTALLYPSGSLTWTQKRVPLDVDIERFENAPLVGTGHRVIVAPVGAASSFGAAREWFSPASFAALDLKSSQTLNNPGFESLTAGLEFGTSKVASSNDAVPAELSITLVKLPQKTHLHSALTAVGYGALGLTESLRESAITPPMTARERAITVTEEKFAMVDAAGVITSVHDSSFQAFQQSRHVAGATATAAADTVVNL